MALAGCLPWDMESENPSSRQRFTRRRLLKAGLLSAAGLALYSGEIERHWINIVQTDVHLPNLPVAFEGARIAQLSDIHMDEYTEPSFLRRVVHQIDLLQPDAVLLTGDFVSEGPGSVDFAIGAAWQCANILSQLKCRQLYAVLGNHDVAIGSEPVTAALNANRIPVLNNACLPLDRIGSRTGGRLWLAGVDDPVNGHPDPERAIPASIRHRPGEPVLLMCHAPDYADDLLATPAGKAVDLMLSGHTHGGQIRLPLLGPLTLPELGRKYIEGWFRFGEMQLYVNRGIGTVGVPFRLDCPPEITLITLRRG
jgi:predicted MPP superfamily phosphohydrolase